MMNRAKMTSERLDPSSKAHSRRYRRNQRWPGQRLLASEEPPLEPARHVDKTDQRRYLDERPITAAKAAPELTPNTATATAIASSKLLLAAVNDSVAVFE